MFAERERQAESSLLKKLGFEKPEDVTTALSKLRMVEDGQKSELQKAQDQQCRQYPGCLGDGLEDDQDQGTIK